MRMIELILAPLTWLMADALVFFCMVLEKIPFRRSPTGYDNPRVRRMVGGIGYWAHTFRLTLPNIRKWLKTRGELFPLVLQVQTINRCNGACSFCPYPYTVHLQEKRTMDDALYSKIVDECVAEPDLHDFVPMSKNEPLLDVKMEARVAEFKRKAQPHQLVELVTNGAALTPTRMKRLIAAGLDLLTVSVNASNETTYNQVMVKLSWKQVMNNLEALSKENLSMTNVYLRFVSEQDNRKDLQIFRRRWQGFNLFSFTVNNRAGTVKDFETRIIHYSDFIQRLKRMAGSHIYPVCPYIFGMMHILENGDVPMCSNDWANREILGNVRAQSIREIYNSPRMNQIRALMAQGGFEEIDACRECSFYHEFMKPLTAKENVQVAEPMIG
ncbi:MAG: radical SAM protein [Anaerolineales bacterium]|nr:radical SAM protein [Anaerolineales bacterium]